MAHKSKVLGQRCLSQRIKMRFSLFGLRPLNCWMLCHRAINVCMHTFIVSSDTVYPTYYVSYVLIAFCAYQSFAKIFCC